MDPSQYTPREDLVPQLCHSFTFFSKHILLQLGLNKIINAAPQGLCFPSAVIYNSLGNIFALQNWDSNNQNNYFFTSCTFLRYVFSRHLLHLQRDSTSKWSRRAVPKITLDWTGTEQRVIPISWQLTPLPRQVQSICWLPCVLSHCIPTEYTTPLSVMHWPYGWGWGCWGWGWYNAVCTFVKLGEPEPAGEHGRGETSCAKLRDRMLQLNAEIKS